MLERASNTRRKQVRTSFFLAAICTGMLCLFFIVASLFLLVIKPHYLDKTSTSGVAHHVASWYGSRNHLLQSPSDVAFDARGRLYVADAGAGEIVLFDRYGQRTGAFGKSALTSPISLAVGRDGRVYVVDAARKELLIFARDHELIKTISFTEKSPLAVSVGADQASDLSGDEALYVTCETGVIKGTLEGVFERGYFNAGTKTGEFSGLADVKTSQSAGSSSQKTPRLFLLDSLNKKVIALDSFESSPTVAWTNTQAILPAGLTNDESHVYVTDALRHRVLVLNAQTGKLLSTLGRKGTQDGALYQPRGIEIQGEQLYVADAGNGRIEIFNIPGYAAAKIETTSPFEVYGLLALCLVWGLSSLACLVVRSRIKPQRYIVDFTTADALERADVREPIEHIAETLWYVPELGEWLQRGLMHSSLRARPAKPSQKARDYIAGLNLDIDAFDSETLACAYAKKLTLIVTDDALKAYAQKAGIATVSVHELAQAYQDEQEAARLNEQHSDEEKLDEQDEGATTARSLGIALALGVLTLLIMTLFASHAYAAGVEHSVVSLSSLPHPEALQSAPSKVSSDKKPVSHAMWESNCASCHESADPQDDEVVHVKNSTCQFCHTASGLGGGYMAYRANGGNAADLGEKNSGHQVGLHDEIPASSLSGLSELSCFSCHSAHNAKNMADARECTSCHNKARASRGKIAAYKEDKKSQQSATDHFVLSKSVSAHNATLSPENGNAAHSAAGLTCASCHRGSLSAQGSCSPCHYSEKDFQKDSTRAAQTSDWPHLSTNDTALLGDWTTVSSGKNIGKRTRISGGMTLENQTRVACGRCHTTQDGKSFALSVHTVKHDAVRSEMVDYLKSQASTSTLSAVSPGYMGTGGNANSAPFASSFEFGPDDGSFEGVPCADCHYSDVQTEHQLRSKKGCSACHKKKDTKGNADWSQVVGNVDAQAFSSCGTQESACHKDSWHGTDPQKTIKAHKLTTSSGSTLKKTSCATDEKGLSCHGSASTQSLFKFGAQDLASAHNDYWVAQKQKHSTNTLYTETITNLDSLRGCGLCHDKQTSVVNGVKQREKARAMGQSFDCSSCHTKSTAVYAEDSCLKAPQWKAPTLQAVRKKVAEDELTQEANAYLRKLAQQTSDNDVKDAGDNEITSKLKASTVDASLKSVPTEILPTTHPLAPSSPFSIIRAYLAPYPSLLNRPTTSWENV